MWAQAKNGMTAEDILRSINSRLTKDALQIISGEPLQMALQNFQAHVKFIKCFQLVYALYA